MEARGTSVEIVMGAGGLATGEGNDEEEAAGILKSRVVANRAAIGKKTGAVTGTVGTGSVGMDGTGSAGTLVLDLLPRRKNLEDFDFALEDRYPSSDSFGSFAGATLGFFRSFGFRFAELDGPSVS